ncbi:hypothetical protein EMIT0P253_210040 [Pseudomonas sp. IT-P253]
MEIVCCVERCPPWGRVSLVGQYGSSCLLTAELSHRHDETSMDVAVNGAAQEHVQGRRHRCGCHEIL